MALQILGCFTGMSAISWLTWNVRIVDVVKIAVKVLDTETEATSDYDYYTMDEADSEFVLDDNRTQSVQRAFRHHHHRMDSCRASS